MGYIQTSILIYSHSPLTINLFLLMFDRMFDTAFFNVAGGNTIVISTYSGFSTPRSLYLNFTVFGLFSDIFYFLKKEIIRIHCNGFCDYNRIFRFHGMGSPYVYSWFRSVASSVSQ